MPHRKSSAEYSFAIFGLGKNPFQMDHRSAIEDLLVKGRERRNDASSLQKKNYANRAQLAIDLLYRSIDTDVSIAVAHESNRGDRIDSIGTLDADFDVSLPLDESLQETDCSHFHSQEDTDESNPSASSSFDCGNELFGIVDDDEDLRELLGRLCVSQLYRVCMLLFRLFT